MIISKQPQTFSVRDKQTVFIMLQQIFSDVVGPMKRYELHHHLFDDLHLDSAGIMSLVQQIEDSFLINLPLNEDTPLETVNDLVELIYVLLKEKDHPSES